jgi:hypothetical protein
MSGYLTNLVSRSLQPLTVQPLQGKRTGVLRPEVPSIFSPAITRTDGGEPGDVAVDAGSESSLQDPRLPSRALKAIPQPLKPESPEIEAPDTSTGIYRPSPAISEPLRSSGNTVAAATAASALPSRVRSLHQRVSDSSPNSIERQTEPIYEAAVEQEEQVYQALPERTPSPDEVRDPRISAIPHRNGPLDTSQRSRPPALTMPLVEGARSTNSNPELRPVDQLAPALHQVIMPLDLTANHVDADAQPAYTKPYERLSESLTDATGALHSIRENSETIRARLAHAEPQSEHSAKSLGFEAAPIAGVSELDSTRLLRALRAVSQVAPPGQADSEPVIHVSIGRIEVRAPSQTPTKHSSRESAKGPSLEEYLRGRTGRGRA